MQDFKHEYLRTKFHRKLWLKKVCVHKRFWDMVVSFTCATFRNIRLFWGGRGPKRCFRCQYSICNYGKTPCQHIQIRGLIAHQCTTDGCSPSRGRSNVHEALTWNLCSWKWDQKLNGRNDCLRPTEAMTDRDSIQVGEKETIRTKNLFVSPFGIDSTP